MVSIAAYPENILRIFKVITVFLHDARFVPSIHFLFRKKFFTGFGRNFTPRCRYRNAKPYGSSGPNPTRSQSLLFSFFFAQESRRNSSSRKPSDSTQRSDEIQPVQRKKHAAPQRRPSGGKETVYQDRCRVFNAFVRILRRYECA